MRTHDATGSEPVFTGLIADLDRPQEGLLKVSQQAMIDLDPDSAVLTNLDADKATVAARRIVRRKIEAENAKTT